MPFLRRHWTIISLGILLLAAAWIGLTSLVAGGTTQGLTPAPQAGFLAPDFSLTTLDGDTITLSDFQGKPVILNIWASWCPPCRTEMPALQSVYADYQSAGLQVLGLNTTYQDSMSDISGFLAQNNLTFPILLDLDSTASSSYQVNALPSTYFIRPDGTIHKVVIGGPIPESLLRSVVIELFEEKD